MAVSQLRLQERDLVGTYADGSRSPLSKQLTLRSISGFPILYKLTLHFTRKTDTLHTFYAMDDGSCLAFFEAPDMKFAFKKQKDFDLHIALEVDDATMEAMIAHVLAFIRDASTPGKREMVDLAELVADTRAERTVEVATPDPVAQALMQPPST